MPFFLQYSLISFIVLYVGLIIYNVKVIKPKNTYNEAMTLLEKGKYEEADKMLDSIGGYKDVKTIKEQIKWEAIVYECVTDVRQYLKNPDSLQVYEVAFYDGYKSDLDDTKKDAGRNFCTAISRGAGFLGRIQRVSLSG